jgi:hypothetical protein
MREIIPGVHHWSAYHDPIGAEVSSYYLAASSVVLDPKLPDGGLDALPGRPAQVVLTSGHHARDAERFAEAFGIPIRVSQEGAERLGGAVGGIELQPFGDGEEVAAGLSSIHIGVLSEDEGALYLDHAGGALAFADGVHHYRRALGFFDDELLGDDPERVKLGLRRAFEALLTRDFDHLLFAHGQPVVGGGKAALREFAASR